MYSIVLCVLVLTEVLTFACNATVQVNIKQGSLSGIEATTFIKEQKYYAFKGIPFALPPINELRFKPPKEHPGWEGTYEGYTEAQCIQYNMKMRHDDFGVFGSEDCLYLNVFTPSIERTLPVIVFEYNDHFKTSFNGTSTYASDFFIEEDIVVVTINHRLGIFGYLTTESDHIPANAGLKDFILGLQWIQNNIAKFGGDPHKVTIMGSGGGAAIGNILLYSRKATGLFHNIIMQSGTAYEPIYFHRNPKNIAFAVGEELGIKSNDSEILLLELQKLDAEILIKNASNILNRKTVKTIQMDVFPFAMTVEQDNPDAILTSLPEDSEIVNDVPVLIGFNSREGLDMISYLISEPRLLEDLTADYVRFPIRQKFRFDHSSTIYEQASKEIREFYLKDGYLHSKNILDYSVFVQDSLLMYAVDETVKQLASRLESSLYFYMFDYRGSLNENSNFISKRARSSTKNWGATVEDELCYLVLCSRIKHVYQELQKRASKQPEIKVLEKMVQMWSNFVKSGNPTPKDDIKLKQTTWLPVDSKSENVTYLHITKSLKNKINPLGERAKFWTEFLDKYSMMAIDGVVRDQPLKDEL